MATILKPTDLHVEFYFIDLSRKKKSTGEIMQGYKMIHIKQ